LPNSGGWGAAPSAPHPAHITMMKQNMTFGEEKEGFAAYTYYLKHQCKK